MIGTVNEQPSGLHVHAGPLQNNNSLSINGINVPKFLLGMRDIFRGTEELKNRTFHLLFGVSGAGKSRLINYMLGCTHRLSDEGELELDPPEQKEFAKSKNGPSITPRASCYQNLADGPGIGDTHGMEIQKAIDVGLCTLFQAPESIQSVVVVAELDSIIGRRITYFGDACDRLCHLIPNIAGMKPSIHFVITKVDNLDYALNKFLARIRSVIDKYTEHPNVVSVLSLMDKDNVILADFTRPQMRCELSQKLSQTRGIPIQKPPFLHAAELRPFVDTCFKMINETQHEIADLEITIDDLSAHIESIKAEIAYLEVVKPEIEKAELFARNYLTDTRESLLARKSAQINLIDKRLNEGRMEIAAKGQILDERISRLSLALQKKAAQYPLHDPEIIAALKKLAQAIDIPYAHVNPEVKRPLRLLDLPKHLLQYFFANYLPGNHVIPSRFVCRAFRNLTDRKNPQAINYARFAAANGYLNTLKWALAQGARWSDMLAIEAQRGGHTEVLAWAQEKGAPLQYFDYKTEEERRYAIRQRWSHMCGVGASNLFSCAFFLGQTLKSPSSTLFYPTEPDKVTQMIEDAAQRGPLSTLQWLRAKNAPWDHERILEVAMVNGNLEVIQWLHPKARGLDAAFCGIVAGRGHLHILQWARANGVPWDERVCRNAALSVYRLFPTLEWAMANNAPLDPHLCEKVAQEGNLEILQFLVEKKKIPWDEQLAYYLTLNRFKSILQKQKHEHVNIKNVLEWIIERGNVKI